MMSAKRQLSHNPQALNLPFEPGHKAGWINRASLAGLNPNDVPVCHRKHPVTGSFRLVALFQCYIPKVSRAPSSLKVCTLLPHSLQQLQLYSDAFIWGYKTQAADQSLRKNCRSCSPVQEAHPIFTFQAKGQAMRPLNTSRSSCFTLFPNLSYANRIQPQENSHHIQT